MIDPRPLETTFIVFRLDGVRVGVPASAVESVTIDLKSDDEAPQSASPIVIADPAHLTHAQRLLLLRSREGRLAPPLRVRGTLQVITLPQSRVCPLPLLCTTTRSAVTEVALSDDQIEFLIIDPHRLIDATASTEVSVCK